jgi:hypothetical protein
MEKEALEILKKITSKEVYELNSFEIAFLKARRSYLTKEEKEKFAEVLEDKKKENKVKKIKEDVKKEKPEEQK